jgi:hypothetical protein
VASEAASTPTTQRAGVKTPASNSLITDRDVAGVRAISGSRELDLATAVDLCAPVDAARRSSVADGMIALGRREGG